MPHKDKGSQGQEEHVPPGGEGGKSEAPARLFQTQETHTDSDVLPPGDVLTATLRITAQSLVVPFKYLL